MSWERPLVSRFTEAEQEFSDRITSLVDKLIRPVADKIERSNRIPDGLIETLASEGLLQYGLPASYGGPGGTVVRLCIAREEFSRVSQTCALLVGRNWITIIQTLLAFGTEEQKKKFLPELSKGQALTAVAITEKDAGSDVAAMKSSAVRAGDSYVLNGEKLYVSWAPVAKYIVVYARTGNERGLKGISSFIIERGTPGLEIGEQDEMLGLNGCPVAPIRMENVRIPVENRLGEEGEGFTAAMRLLNANRPTVGALSVGLAQGALDLAVEHARSRRQFGRAIGEFQGMQFMLADMQIQTQAARSLVYDAARLADNQDYDNLASFASMAKCFASDVAMKVTTDAVQVLGGLGFMKSSPAERFMRDAKVNQIFEGTNQIQRMIVAKRLLKPN